MAEPKDLEHAHAHAHACAHWVSLANCSHLLNNRPKETLNTFEGLSHPLSAPESAASPLHPPRSQHGQASVTPHPRGAPPRGLFRPSSRGLPFRISWS